MVIFENIDIDINIDKEISENINIDEILNRLEFGISNRATHIRPIPINHLSVSQAACFPLVSPQPKVGLNESGDL